MAAKTAITALSDLQASGSRAQSMRHARRTERSDDAPVFLSQVAFGEAVNQCRAADATGVMDVTRQVNLHLAGANEGAVALDQADRAFRVFDARVGAISLSPSRTA